MNKAQDLENKHLNGSLKWKTQLETGELKVEDLVKSGKEKSLETFEQIKEKLQNKIFLQRIFWMQLKLKLLKHQQLM